MPDINSIPVPSYQPLQPYYWVYDNLPLEALIQREDLINNAVDMDALKSITFSISSPLCV